MNIHTPINALATARSRKDPNPSSEETQSRSQSMPVRRLVVGVALAKSNELCNFIGCREINETDIELINGNARFLRELCVGSWIMRNDVNKKMTRNHS